MNAPIGIIERPSAQELLELVADFLEKEITPIEMDEKLRFRVRVAANLLRIVHRELELMNDDEFKVDADGYLVPAEMLRSAPSLRTLVRELHEGARDLLDPEMFALATRYVEAKLAIAAPGVLKRGRDEK